MASQRLLEADRYFASEFLAESPAEYRGWEWYYLQRQCGLLLTLKGHTGWVNAVAWSPAATRLASASSDQTVKVWDAKSGQEALTLKARAGEVWGVAWSPEGTRLASACGESLKPGEVKLWEMNPEQYWNIREAASAERAQQWYAAAFHLNPLVEAETRFAALEAVSGATGPSPLAAAATLQGLRSLDVRCDLADLLRRRDAASAKLAAGDAKPGQ